MKKCEERKERKKKKKNGEKVGPLKRIERKFCAKWKRLSRNEEKRVFVFHFTNIIFLHFNLCPKQDFEISEKTSEKQEEQERT